MILGIGALTGVIALGSTLAANINLNAGSTVEFGQGITQATACDNDITVTPLASFINTIDTHAPAIILNVSSAGLSNSRALYTSDSTGDIRLGQDVTGLFIPNGAVVTSVVSGTIVISKNFTDVIAVEEVTFTNPPARHMLSGFAMSGVDSSSGKCAGKSFTLTFYSANDRSPLATYDVYDSGTEFNSPVGTVSSNFTPANQSSFALTLNQPTVVSSKVDRVTIESHIGYKMNIKQIGVYPGALVGENCTGTQCEVNPDFCDETGCSTYFVPMLDLLTEFCRATSCNGLTAILENLKFTLSQNLNYESDMSSRLTVEFPGLGGTGHLDGQVLYKGADYEIFRWFQNTNESNNPKLFIDFIISTNGDLPLSGPGTPFTTTSPAITVPFYSIAWSPL